jgi:arsenite-transporting ATPase
VCRAEDAHKYTDKPIYVKALSFIAGNGGGLTDPNYDYTTFPEIAACAVDAYAQAGVTNAREQVAMAEVHDCFAITELLMTEALGFAAHGQGVVLTMGKGGVGKTSVAVAIAVALARRGFAVHLTTTDPAAHVAQALGAPVEGITVSRIDPVAETRDYAAFVMAGAGAGLDAAGRALLEEDLRSPCTEEIAVFRAFARTVHEGTSAFVVIDTAPTGHTLLLLDAAESYHREVLRKLSDNPVEVRELLPRLRDPDFTRVLLITLPEATPVHEAAALQRDLQRATITPFAWVVNQSLQPLAVTDPVLVSRKAHEARYLTEITTLTQRAVLVPWRPLHGDDRAELMGA